jgi:hypothetical protein
MALATYHVLKVIYVYWECHIIEIYSMPENMLDPFSQICLSGNHGDHYLCTPGHARTHIRAHTPCLTLEIDWSMKWATTKWCAINLFILLAWDFPDLVWGDVRFYVFCWALLFCLDQTGKWASSVSEKTVLSFYIFKNLRGIHQIEYII